MREVGFYTTGDPFVHKELPAFVAFANEVGTAYKDVSTNGALATPRTAAAVIDAGLDSIKFSINAGSRATYALVHGKDDFGRVIDNLTWISEYRKTLHRPLYNCLHGVLAPIEPLTPEFATPVDWPESNATSRHRLQRPNCPQGGSLSHAGWR